MSGRRYKGIRSPASKGGVVIGRMRGAGVGDLQELDINYVTQFNPQAQAQTAATAKVPQFVPVQNQGIIITNANGDAILVNLNPNQ